MTVETSPHKKRSHEDLKVEEAVKDAALSDPPAKKGRVENDELDNEKPEAKDEVTAPTNTETKEEKASQDETSNGDKTESKGKENKPTGFAAYASSFSSTGSSAWGSKPSLWNTVQTSTPVWSKVSDKESAFGSGFGESSFGKFGASAFGSGSAKFGEAPAFGESEKSEKPFAEAAWKSKDNSNAFSSESTPAFGQIEGNDKYKVQEVHTGEENETTLVSIRGKLYELADSKWSERGSGVLKLNSPNEGSSTLTPRLVMRADATHRLIINSNVFPGQTVSKSSDKVFRFVVLDGCVLRIYSLRANSQGIQEFIDIFQEKIDERKKSEPEAKETETEKDAGGKIEEQAEDSKSTGPVSDEINQKTKESVGKTDEHNGNSDPVQEEKQATKEDNISGQQVAAEEQDLAK